MSKWSSERSIHEMLKDTPPLGDSSGSVTSGTEGNFPTSKSMTFPSTYAEASQTPSASTVESWRAWGVSAYRCTRQLVLERVGRAPRSVDAELEAQVEALREAQRRHAHVQRLATQLAAHLASGADSSRALADALAELAQREPELRDDLLRGAEAQRTLGRAGDTLSAALRRLSSALSTLCRSSMEDTLVTARRYETARLELDALKLEEGGAARRKKYESLREDVSAKLRLLTSHRVLLLRRQLRMLHAAVRDHLTGHSAALPSAPPPPPPPAPTAPPTSATPPTPATPPAHE